MTVLYWFFVIIVVSFFFSVLKQFIISKRLVRCCLERKDTGIIYTDLACLPLFGLRRGGNSSITLRAARETLSHQLLNMAGLTLTECQERLTTFLQYWHILSSSKHAWHITATELETCIKYPMCFSKSISWWFLLTCQFWSAQIFSRNTLQCHLFIKAGLYLSTMQQISSLILGTWVSRFFSWYENPEGSEVLSNSPLRKDIVYCVLLVICLPLLLSLLLSSAHSQSGGPAPSLCLYWDTWVREQTLG